MTDVELQRKISNMETTLTGSFRAELAELQRLQREAEERRKKEEEAQKQQQDKLANEQKEALSKLLQLQVEDAQERTKRQGLWTKILAAFATIVTALAAGGVYLGTQGPTQEQVEEQAKSASQPVVDQVDRKTAEIEHRVGTAEKKIERLKDIALEQQVQIADSTAYIVSKIDAALPKSAKSVPEPDSVRKAKLKAEAIKRAQESDSKVLFDPRSTDPFAGLDEVPPP
jgi:exonuclease VII large subunit